MSLADAARAFADAETLVMGREHSTNTGRVLALSEGNRITAYDLEFVSLANRLAVPLVTFDKEVLAAFPNVAVHPAQFIAAT